MESLSSSKDGTYLARICKVLSKSEDREGSEESES